MKTRFLPGLTVTLLAVLLGAPAFASVSKVLQPSTKTRTKDDTTAVQLPPYRGVKHALGVLDFENTGGYFTERALGDNMRLMLESSLAATNRFVMVERGELGAIMAEQDLQSGKRAAHGSGVAQTGKIRSARFLAAGAITEASTDTSGDGGGINLRGFRIGGSSEKSVVVAVVKLIDTTSGEIVASERIRGEAGHTRLNLGYQGSDFGGQLGAFARTPLGEAAQNCIDQAVVFIARRMESEAVEGSIVSIAGEEIIINLGEKFGIGAGQAFVVRERGEVLTDPSTGEVLDVREGGVVATIEVTRVREKVSYCKLVQGTMPARGDTVVLHQ